MENLEIFKSNLVNTLHGSIKENFDRYLHHNVWVTSISTKENLAMPTQVKLSKSLFLDLPENGDLRDIENAIRLHKALFALTPLQARDPRLWTRLVHVEFWPYMRARWPLEKHIAKREKAARFIENRYFVAQNQSRALLRNGIARLWWTAQLSYDPQRENPYELTEVLLSTLDITQQIVERGMGRANNIIKGFLEFLCQNNDLLLIGGNKNRARIRALAKHLNMRGGICILDLLSKAELMEILDNELVQILKNETV